MSGNTISNQTSHIRPHVRHSPPRGGRKEGGSPLELWGKKKSRLCSTLSLPQMLPDSPSSWYLFVTKNRTRTVNSTPPPRLLCGVVTRWRNGGRCSLDRGRLFSSVLLLTLLCDLILTARDFVEVYHPLVWNGGIFQERDPPTTTDALMHPSQWCNGKHKSSNKVHLKTKNKSETHAADVFIACNSGVSPSRCNKMLIIRWCRTTIWIGLLHFGRSRLVAVRARTIPPFVLLNSPPVLEAKQQKVAKQWHCPLGDVLLPAWSMVVFIYF